MNKKLICLDNNATVDNATIKHTHVIIREMGTGRTLFNSIKNEGPNKVIISGSEVNANKLFNFGTGNCFMENNKDDGGVYTHYSSKIPSYDEALAANGKALTYPDNLTRFNSAGYSLEESRKIYLFACGIDGCGLEDSRKFTVQKDKWIAPYGPLKTGDENEYDNGVTTCLIPFRYQQCTVVDGNYQNDLTDEERTKYFGRAVMGNNVAYFFKTFDSPPELIQRYTDGTNFADIGTDSDVWKTDKTADAEVVVKLKMTISKSDVRDWFEYSTGQGTSRVNTISLCSAVPYQDANGIIYYKDIRPVTKYNFNNESMIDSSKSLDITYYLYF